mgnify:CR=1 FL=1
MKPRIGIDLVENKRFNHFLEEDRKLKRILSLDELAVLATFTSKERKLEYIASRFAAKEALVKAGLSFNFQEVSILNNEDGSPFVSGFSDVEILISISHTKEYSTVFLMCYDKL